MRAFVYALLLGASTAIPAQTPALGPEFQVNAYTTLHQVFPGVTSDAAGNFITVWSGAGPDNTFGVFVRRFDSRGHPLGPDVPIDTGLGANGGVIAANAAGEFVVAWQNYRYGYKSDVYARRYDSAGNPASPPVMVNTYVTGYQTGQRVGIDAAGNFVVVWGSWPGQDGSQEGVFGQRFDSSGGRLGTEFQVNTYTSGHQSVSDISVDPLGDFVVVWSGEQPGSSYDILGQRYEAGGTPQGGEFRINEGPSPGADFLARVDSDASGNFVVTWMGVNEQDWGVFARCFHADGTPRGSAFLVEDQSMTQARPDVAMSLDGAFTIAWDTGELVPALAFRIFARSFDPDGIPTTASFALNSNTTLSQQIPDIARDERGGFVVVWQCVDAPCLDGDQSSSQGRTGGVPIPRPLRVDPGANGVLEPDEQAIIEPSWTNNAGLDLELTGTASGFGGPAGPSYVLVDPKDDYGTIDEGATADCQTATGNCLIVSITGNRPVVHWDATFDETLSTSARKTWTLHVGDSFADVPVAHPSYAFVENVFHNGVTGGCGGVNYCPDDLVTRGQMAVFLLKSKHGTDYLPPPCSGTFLDVPCPGHQFADWIEQLSAEGITGGCGGGNYCPDNPVSRAQMAVFLLKTKNGSTYTPPDCAGIFGDVTCPSQFADWIEQLAAEGITGGCGGGNYCPDNPNNRGQMAVFLTKTFDLQLYGP